MKKVKNTVLMALAMTMAIGTTAFAEDTKIEDLTTTAPVVTESSIVVPTISVTVPTSASIILNPYGLEDDESTTPVEATDEIVSTEITISNAGNTKMEVILDSYEVNITAAEGSTDKITLATAPIVSTTTSVKKDLFLYLKDVDTDTSAIKAYDSKTDAKKVVKAGINLNTSLGVMDVTDGTLTLKFGGNLNKKAEWKETDAISVTPAFKFVPRTNDVITQP